MSEIEWRDVKAYEGLYRVSSDGQVFSARSGKILKPHINTKGYARHWLQRDGQKAFFTHRLVAVAFLGASDLQVNHIDGDKSNNRVENLEWCSGSDNVKHAYRTGLKTGAGGGRYHRRCGSNVPADR